MVCQAPVPPALYGSHDPTTVFNKPLFLTTALLEHDQRPPTPIFCREHKKTAKLHEQPYIYILKKGRGQSSIQYVSNLPGPEERRGDRVGGQRHDEAGSFFRRIHKP